MTIYRQDYSIKEWWMYVTNFMKKQDNRRHQTSSLNSAPCYHFERMPYSRRLCLVIMCKYSVIRKTGNTHCIVLYCRRKQTDPRPQATCKKLVKFRYVVFEISERTDIQTQTFSSQYVAPLQGQSNTF